MSSSKKLKKSDLIASVIDFYRDNPSLWSSKDPKHKDRTHTCDLLTQFGKTFDPILTASEIETKWSTAKSNYSKTKKELAQASKSGSGSYNKKIWKHFDKMQFINEQMEPVGPAIDISNYSIHTAENDSNSNQLNDKEKDPKVDNRQSNDKDEEYKDDDEQFKDDKITDDDKYSKIDDEFTDENESLRTDILPPYSPLSTNSLSNDNTKSSSKRSIITVCGSNKKKKSSEQNSGLNLIKDMYETTLKARTLTLQSSLNSNQSVGSLNSDTLKSLIELKENVKSLSSNVEKSLDQSNDDNYKYLLTLKSNLDKLSSNPLLLEECKLKLQQVILEHLIKLNSF